MNKINLTIWGRGLDVGVIYDCYSGETVLPYQRDAFDAFLANAPALLNSAESKVKEYILSTNPEEIDGSEITNIFRYVKPKDLFIKRNRDEQHIVALLCSYKFNPEAGMAIVFRDEALTSVGTQNEIL